MKETIKLASGLEYYRDFDERDGSITMLNPKTINRYIELWVASIKGLNKGDVLSYDNLKEQVAKECDPQEVYFYEFNNFECMYGYDGDEEAIRKVIEFFGVEVAEHIKRHDVVHSIKSIMTPRWIKQTRLMLNRLMMDCKYYLGNGNRNPKYLWAGDEKEQIAEMRKLLAKLPDDEKPDWLTSEKIDEYESKMLNLQTAEL